MRLITDRQGNLLSFGQPLDLTAEGMVGNLGAPGQALIVAANGRQLTWGSSGSGGGGTIDGSGAAGRLALWSDTDTLTSDADLTYASDTLLVKAIGMGTQGGAVDPGGIALWDQAGDFAYIWAGDYFAGTRAHFQLSAQSHIFDVAGSTSLQLYEGGGAMIGSFLDLPEAAAPATPSSGFGRFYVKTDGQPYFKNDVGTEYNLATTGSSPADISNYIPSDGWLTPTGTWSYYSADDPSFVMSSSGSHAGILQPGQRLKWTQTTERYGIITKVEYNSGSNLTLVTLYGGTDYDLANAAISSLRYSPVKVPFGFPADPSKWTVELENDQLQTEGSPTIDTWYNTGSLSLAIPIGIWNVSFQATTQVNDAGSGTVTAFGTLSTTNNSETDTEFSGYALGTSLASTTFHRQKILSLASKTTYYVNIKTASGSIDNIFLRGDLTKTVVRALCAYL